MPADQFRELKPGDRLPGLPTQPWNKFLAREKAALEGDPAAEGRPTTGVEVRVCNQTAGNLDVYSVLGLAQLNAYTADPDTWRASDTFAGSAPTPTSVVGILQNGLGPGQFGFARLAGRTACRVDVTNVAHMYAGPTTLTGNLVSAASGPARILALENNWTATGPQWAVVILLPGTGAGTRYALFTLAGALTTTTASLAACPVNEYWGGADPGPTITVWNLPASAGYIFSGASGHKGLATYQAEAAKWRIVQLECP